jgi:hypothetical protein
MNGLSTWLKGLISAAIGAAANSVTLMIADPTTFNLTTGLKKVGTVALVSAIVSCALYLKQSPLPGIISNTSSSLPLPPK